MKYEIKDIPEAFQPFQFTVTVETEDELALWRMILGDLTHDASTLTYDLYGALGKEWKRRV